MSFPGAAVLFLALLFLASPLAAQECEGGRITSVVVDNNSIFDLGEMEEDVSFRWLYSLMNTLHMDTNENFVRNELLFEEGDCLDPLALEESERILRAYEFIARVEIFDEPAADGGRRVVVETQDEWTTELDVRLAFDEGFRLEGVELTEENFLGRGMFTGFFFFERRERRDLGVFFETPRLFSTRWDARFSAGKTRVGNFFNQALVFPFVGEVGRVAARQRYSYRESLFPYSIPESAGSPYSHVLVPFQERDVELTLARRLGRPGNLTIFGVGFLRETLSFDEFPGDVEVSGRDGDFDETQPAGPAETAAVAGQVTNTTISRVNLLFGQRNLRFVQRSDLDLMRGVQDVRLGTDVNLTVGRSLGDIASGGRDAPEDVYTRLRAFAGWEPGRWLLNADLNAEARNIFSGPAEGQGWRDILGEFDAYTYWRPTALPDHTLFGRFSASGGWSTVRPFQLTLGGRTAVRGFSESDFPGNRRLVVSVEDRFYLGWPAPDLFDLGMTFFADAGKIWAGDVPYGETVPWQASLGAGLRLEFPSQSRNTLRIDLAVPVSGSDAFGSPIFRVTFLELLGVRPGFADEEIFRSRRPSVGADLLTEEPR
ncbi:MAG: BamA/TamA family outer membrane protein [Gemmatimonadetes bacterium]|nr:BamA/TamA family outer membrane protein [Gemmatimonadota bacterium]NIR79117.1 BamA/TamA family outer membrane protein [Gemmatimonadota bacterium]NIT87770.1 BamA/TamA family outer membrane protein [Gemmatimonadota bacterium]NIU31633.1 BamA/TamA family outer membrane protein [Gemmatimonadota bacterium]NIU36260.1 BamA/TamA family outer membrane protein [Gemmatimonadota bacterium]